MCRTWVRGGLVALTGDVPCRLRCVATIGQVCDLRYACAVVSEPNIVGRRRLLLYFLWGSALLLACVVVLWCGPFFAMAADPVARLLFGRHAVKLWRPYGRTHALWRCLKGLRHFIRSAPPQRAAAAKRVGGCGSAGLLTVVRDRLDAWGGACRAGRCCYLRLGAAPLAAFMPTSLHLGWFPPVRRPILRARFCAQSADRPRRSGKFLRLGVVFDRGCRQTQTWAQAPCRCLVLASDLSRPCPWVLALPVWECRGTQSFLDTPGCCLV